MSFVLASFSTLISPCQGTLCLYFPKQSKLIIIWFEGLQTMNKSEVEKERARLSYSIRHILIAMFFLAIPLAFFSAYWSRVNDTADERTIALSKTSGFAMIYFIATAISMVLAISVSVWWLFTRRNYKTAILTVGLVALMSFMAAPLVRSKILEPVNGNPMAEVHNNAASITAMAVIRFFEKHGRWPSNWNDLEEDITTVLTELNTVHQKFSANPDPFAKANAADPYWGEEASQAISTRAPDLIRISLSSLPTLVDVNFAADPSELALQKWYEFKGIIPKKPSYNLYRVEFTKLISLLSK
jgi:hypothetical protein